MNQQNIAINTLVFDEWMKEGKYQTELLEEIRNLGITKVEIRREYLRGKDELRELKEKAEQLGIDLFYSVPDILFEGELLPKETLAGYFEEYNLLGAKQLKLVAGWAEDVSASDLDTLKSLVDEYAIHHVTLENDQSDYSRPAKLKNLLHQVQAAGVDAGLTFDTGNFVITQQDPLECAEALKDDVTFVHLKNVDAETHEMTLIDEGAVPMVEVIDVFPEQTVCAIEYPCGGEPFETVKKDIDKLLS